MSRSLYQQLPLPARCAVEYLGCQPREAHTIAKLNAYLDHYSNAYGMVLPDAERAKAQKLAIQQYTIQGDALAGVLPPALEAT